MATFLTWEGIVNATPKVVKRIRTALIFVIGGSLAFTPILAPKFNVSPGDFAEWAGLATMLVQGVSMLFGVTDEEAVQIAKDKISEVKTKQAMADNSKPASLTTTDDRVLDS